MFFFFCLVATNSWFACRYNGTSFDTIAGVTALSDPIEVFTHTTYLTRNGPTAMDEEEASQPNDAAAVPPPTATVLDPRA